MKKNTIFSIVSVIFTLFVLLFVCVGCADNSAEDCDEVTFIDLNRESASSRGIESWNEDLYPPESLYWTYTAKKIRGNYTTGQALTEQAVVENGPATGLGTVGPFSVGVWEFNLYGYLSCAENPSTGELEFTDLVYTGKTGTETNNYITIDKRPDASTPVQKIIFELSATSFWDSLEGQLAIENLKLTVPEGQRISGTKPAAGKSGAEIIIKIWEGIPSDANLPIAKSITVISEDKESGSVLNSLNTPAFIDYSGVIKNKFNAAVTHNFYIAAEYLDVFTKEQEAGAYKWSAQPDTDIRKYIYDDGYAPIGAIVSYPLAFKGGVKTTISGDINDIQVAEDGEAHNEKFYGAVAKILNTTKSTAKGSDVYDLFYTLSDAFGVYNGADYQTSSVANPIIIIHDIEDAGTLTPATDGVVVKVTDESGNRHFIEKLVVSGTTNGIVFKLADTGRDYRFSAKDASTASKIVNLSYDGTASGNVWIHTENGIFDVDAAYDSVYHTGKADSVKLTAVAKTDTSAASPVVKGYFLGTNKTGATPETSVSALEVVAGSLNIGGQAAIETLTVSAGSSAVTVCGKTTSYVGNVDAVRDGNSTYVTSTNKDVFKEVKLYANGGTGTSPVTKYGIEGMYMNLVDNEDVSFTPPTGLMFNCWNTVANNRTGVDYSATGKIAVVKDGDGNYPVLYAVWGTPVAKIETATAGTYGYFGTLSDAVTAYDGTNPVVLLANIDGESITPSGSVEINPNTFSLKNITVTNTDTVEIDVDADGERTYTFGGVAGNKLGEFSYVGSEVALKTTGGNLEVNAGNDNIVHTGTIGTLTVTACANNRDLSKGYHLDATVSTSVSIKKGLLEIGVSIPVLDVTGTSDITLRGKYGTSAVVTTKKYGGAALTDWGTVSTNTNGIYKRVILKANNGVTADVDKVYYGIEGLKCTLKAYPFSTSGTFGHWNDEADGLGSFYDDEASLLVGYGDKNLYAYYGIVRLKRSDGATYRYFNTLSEGVSVYNTAEYKVGSTASPVEVIADINGDCAMPATSVKVVTNNHTLKNIAVTGTIGTKELELNVGSSVSSAKKYSYAGGTLDNFVNAGSGTATVQTTGGDVVVNAAADNVTHTGTVNTVKVTAALNDKANNKGYHLNVTNTVTNVEVAAGYVDLTKPANVTTLKVTATTTGKVSLKGTTTTVITNMYSGTKKLNNLYWRVASTDRTVDPSNAYRMWTYNIHNTALTDDNYTVYGIEGMYVSFDVPKFTDTARTAAAPTAGASTTQLPKNIFTAPTRSVGGIASSIAFVLWNSKTDCSGTTYYEGQGRTTLGALPSTDTVVYAMYGYKLNACYFVGTYTTGTNASDYKFFTISGTTITAKDVPTKSMSTTLTNYYCVYATATMPATDRYYFTWGGRYNGSWGFNGVAVGGTLRRETGYGKGNTNYMMVTKSASGQSGTIWASLPGARTSSGYGDLFVGSAQELGYIWDAGLTRSTSSDYWLTSSSKGLKNPSASLDDYEDNINYWAVCTVNCWKTAGSAHGARGSAGSTTYGTRFMRAI